MKNPHLFRDAKTAERYSGPKRKTFPPDRRCADETCIALLSLYNPGPFCYLHAPKTLPKKGRTQIQNERKRHDKNL